jgi:DNA-binding beta-propeller fold protein YncE
VKAGAVPLEIGFDASADVRDDLAALARTEDVRFSPSGRRLAIAGFAGELIAIADVEITTSESGPEIAVTSLDQLESAALREPHGLDFVDDDTLAVGNRGGGVEVFRLPPAGSGGGMTRVDPVDGRSAGLLDSPGSVAVRTVGPGRHELLACNNWSNTLTRHTLDASGALGGGEVVLRKWLDIPDGLALSHDRRWLAVSNHNTHSVLIYEYSELGEDADPVGILRGVNYPHGLRFAADDRCLVVADAGAPYVQVFLPSGGGWEGVAYPAATITVMDDETFQRGRHNPQEGGPKGIDVDPRSGVLVATSECMPIAFFDLAAVLEEELGRGDDALVRYEIDVLGEAQLFKAAAAAEASALRAEAEAIRAAAAAEASILRAETDRALAEFERVAAESEQLRSTLAEANAHLAGVYESKSWRLTEPMRRAFDAARGLRRRVGR